MKEGINVLSLFDGISCGMVALERAGIKVCNYYASEINLNSIKVSKDNYPNIVRLGDINKWSEWPIDFGSIDLIIAGSPCQGFSFCGKQLNFEDDRSKLFFKFKEILDYTHIFNHDVKFLLENVRMKQEYEDTITSELGVSPVMINSSLLSAQMRKRNYWFNWDVDMPSDKGLKLQDVIMDGYVKQDKCWCILESYNRLPKKKESLIKRYNRSMCMLVFDNPECSFDGNIRTLNRVEVERLQTLPDNYTKAVPENIGMGLCGDGWTVDVIAHILKGLKQWQ